MPAFTDSTNGNWIAGQFVNGQAINGSNPETVQIAYATDSGEGVLNCLGGTNTSGGTLIYHNIFSVDATNRILRCKVISINAAGVGTDSGWQNLITNVTGMTVLYGVSSTGGTQIDEYLPIASMTATLFGSVKSIRITLTMSNPAVPGSTPVSWMNTTNLMNN
jgi:type IV pilus assembly protein PilW